MFISNLKSILSSLKTESFLDSSLWCQFREIQIQMIHRVISITSKDDENEELLSKLEKDSEVIDKIIAEIDQRWKMELDHSFIREVSYWDKRLFLVVFDHMVMLEAGSSYETVHKANNRCQKTLSNQECKTLSRFGTYMYKNCPHHKKRYHFKYEFMAAITLL